VKSSIVLKFVHVCVRAGRCVVKLTRPDVALWIWKRLKRAFPEAIAAVLMPNHIHVFAPAGSEHEARRMLRGVISALSRSRNPGSANGWDPVSSRGMFTEPQKIARHIRYIVLNPTRARLVACPLEWVWTTHRDVMGAVLDPWVTAARVATALGQSPTGFRARHHRYVSGDPSTKIESTPAPRAHHRDPTAFSQRDAMAAAIACVRGDARALERRGEARHQFLAFASAAGWPAKAVAPTCALSPDAVRKYLRRGTSPSDAAWLCLGDQRLTSYVEPTARLRAVEAR
jgi:REP element-mobilizing transposase RayT